VEDRLSLLWTYGVRTGRLTMNEFVAVTSTNIAKILNMYPRKGAVAVGADADLIVWDPEATKTISAKTQKSAIDYNVFEGVGITGRPRLTLSRGRVAFEEGEVKAGKGDGQFVERPPHAPVSKALSTWKEITAPRKVERSGIPAGV
jgi:dihydropyrimidinase